MLKITKGLKPFVEEGITSYIDDKGNEYVRVKLDGEDFCITLYDYNKSGKCMFTWNETMMSLGDEGLTTFTPNQASIYAAHRDVINNKLKEMSGEVLKNEKYWTSNEINPGYSGIYNNYSKNIFSNVKHDRCLVRPVINL